MTATARRSITVVSHCARVLIYSTIIFLFRNDFFLFDNLRHRRRIKHFALRSSLLFINPRAPQRVYVLRTTICTYTAKGFFCCVDIIFNFLIPLRVRVVVVTQ